MFPHRLARGLLVGAASLLIAAPAAFADGSTTESIIAECAQGDGIQPGHSAAELSAAIEDLPADVAEYTDCGDQLAAARRMVLNPSRVSTDPLSTTPGFSPVAANAASGDGGATTEPKDAKSATPTLTSADGPVDTESVPATNQVAEGTHATDAPVGTRLGGVAAAGIVGASLLALWRPAMLRRHEGE